MVAAVKPDLQSGLAARLVSVVSRFAEYFRSSTRSVATQAEEYAHGLIQAERKNMEKMAEAVPDTNSQRLQNFLTNSPWDHQKVMAHVARDADKHLGGHPDCSLSVDETSIIKKGNGSVAVQRQWCGRFGKVDNCQVGVFANLCNGEHHTLVDCRLYIPESWAKDPERCRKAGIPECNIVFKPKTQLALELVRNARAQGLRFNWSGFDGGYGKEPWFLRALDDDSEIFMADVHKDQMIWLDDPHPFLPDWNGLGQKPVHMQSHSPSIRVDRWVEQQPASAWQPLTLRMSTKGKLKVSVLHARVWLWDGVEKEARCWHLIVRREMKAPTKIKYSLCNAPPETPPERLAFMQGQRFWVERSFQDGKSFCGMADYQVRLWSGWHHHMAMVMIAMLFMLEERLLQREKTPLLSCADIVALLRHLLPKAAVTEADVLAQLNERHRRRQAAIDSAEKMQSKALG